MSDTPRTDEVSDRTTRTVAVWVLARELERENAALKAELAAKAETGTGYSQQTVDALQKELTRLRGLVERATEIMRLELREAYSSDDSLGQWLKDAEEVVK